jgi:hypothetical protein
MKCRRCHRELKREPRRSIGIGAKCYKLENDNQMTVLIPIPKPEKDEKKK